MEIIGFTDRAKEFKALNEHYSRFRAVPLYVYGPKGCGKLDFLKSLLEV